MLNSIYEFIMMLITGSSFYGPIIACLLIFFESIIPVLPLCVFITILFLSYGFLWGYIISYLLTCLGCFFSFYLCRKYFRNYFNKRIRKIEKLDKFMKIIDNISLSNLSLLIALPFTPAFLVNVAASISDMKFKKFAISIIIGKLFMVAFWGFIGTSLIESLKNPKIMILIVLMMIIVYLISKIVNKKLKIE
jgi:uncharacterized membrane protein YdjX (TVP38/TMEM64 family)